MNHHPQNSHACHEHHATLQARRVRMMVAIEPPIKAVT